MTRTLQLAVTSEYFDAMRAGTKVFEYRLRNAYWSRRLEKPIDRLVITKGYPRSTDHERRMVLPWMGYFVETITHKHFGPAPVEVFAIYVSRPLEVSHAE